MGSGGLVRAPPASRGVVGAESLPRKSPQENRFQIAQPRSRQPSAPCRQPKTTSSTHSIGNRQSIDPSERHRIDDLSPANTETPSQRLPFLRRSSPFDRPRHPYKAASEFLSPLPHRLSIRRQPSAVSRQPSAVRVAPPGRPKGHGLTRPSQPRPPCQLRSAASHQLQAARNSVAFSNFIFNSYVPTTAQTAVSRQPQAKIFSTPKSQINNALLKFKHFKHFYHPLQIRAARTTKCAPQRPTH